MEFCNDRCQDFLAGQFASSRIEFNQLQDLASLHVIDDSYCFINTHSRMFLHFRNCPSVAWIQ